MDDIEDIIQQEERSIDQEIQKKSIVYLKNNTNASKHAVDVDDASSNSQVVVPGTQKVWIKTYGCSHNVSDSEYMEGMLTQYGYRITDNEKDADVWLLNSCTVKDPSQSAVMHVIKRAKDINIPVVVAGCVSQADRSIKELDDVSIVGISQIDRVVEAVESTLQGNKVKMLAKKELPLLDLPKVRKNPLIEIIPLSTGCLGSCTYCKTKHARGKLGSYAQEAIVKRAQSIIDEGVVSEIWLTSEDTGAYGRDIGTDIGQLLNALVAILPEEGVMLRVGMTNPPYILEHLAVVADIMRHPKVFSFLHIPVQAGSNRVLDAMNREYTVEEFKKVADYLIENVPGMTIATDIICGFPNETEADFDLTMKLVGTYKFAICNISQFYPRPGTPAAKMKRINTQIVKNRSRKLTKLFESFTPYVDIPGNVVKVWFGTEISDDKNHIVGHTKSYVKVLVPLDMTLAGKSRYVSIKSAQRFHVVGHIVDKEAHNNTTISNEIYNNNNNNSIDDNTSRSSSSKPVDATVNRNEMSTWVFGSLIVASSIVAIAVFIKLRRK